jgi:RecB family endonuclease NucS
MLEQEIKSELQMTTKDLIPQYDFIGKEKDLEEYILENVNEISNNCQWGEILRIERQFQVPIAQGKVIIDIMIWHKDGTGTAIEVKRSKTNRNDILAGIGQCLSYSLKLESALDNAPRLVIAAPVINDDLYRIINKFKLPINLLMVDGHRCIYLGNGG